MKFTAKEIRPVTLTVGGEDYPALLNHAALIEMEELTAKPMMHIIQAALNQELTFKEYTSFLYAVLKQGGVDVTYDEVMAGVGIGDIGDVYMGIAAMIVAQVPLETKRKNAKAAK
jgi:hypothetical protein